MLYNEEVKSRLLTILKFAIGWPLSFVALYFIYTTFAKQSDGFSQITEVRYSLLFIALICFICYYFFRSYIWLKLLHYLGHQIPFRDSSFLWLSSQLKRYIPGNVWSFVGLAVSYNERKVSKKDLAYAVLIESELVIIVTFILSLLSLPFVLTQFIQLPVSQSVIIPLLTVLFLSGFVLYLFIGDVIKTRKGKFFTIMRHVFSQYTPLQNFTLLLLMSGAYIFYGLGYYFSISAIYPLNPTYLQTYFGIFIFSLVAGYLSVITPTGLGVREGFIALGLSKFMPIGIAGFAALFSRVMIVIAELMTLLLSYLWYKAQDRFKKQEAFLASHLHEIILGILVTLYSLYFSVASMLRYTEYYTGRFDLGNMAQTVWNSSQGRLFMITDPNGTETVSRLAFHADFLLVLLAPFYLLWSDPRMILIIQAVVVALGAVFVYGISKTLLKEKTISLIFAFSFLMNPSVQRSTLYDFHAVVLATTFLLGAVYFLIRKRYVFFLIFALLAALTKEQLWFMVALFGPVLFFWHKQRAWGVALFVSSLCIFYYLLWHAIPNAAGSSAHFALSYFSEGGSSPSDIIKQIILSPVDSLQTIFEQERLNYYQKLLVPIGFLPLAFPFWLIFPAPDLVLNIFSDRVQLQQIYYQYTASISAFLYISAIYGVMVIRKYISRVSLQHLSIYLAIVAVLGAYLYGPLPGSVEPNLDIFTKPQKEKTAIDRELRSIPPDAKVSASNNLASHLSEREHIYVIPRGIGMADVIAVYKTRSNTNAEDTRILSELRMNTSYQMYFENSQIVMFRKK